MSKLSTISASSNALYICPTEEGSTDVRSNCSHSTARLINDALSPIFSDELALQQHLSQRSQLRSLTFAAKKATSDSLEFLRPISRMCHHWYLSS